jgi:glycosyltransferase involved in cell wall biosynthesis
MPLSNSFESGLTTVLIPTFQRAATLRRCLESVMADLGEGDRVLVVNDGSTDSTSAVARSFGPRVSVLERPNGGKAAATNMGLAHVTTEYCWVFDDDDVVLEGAIGRLSSFMNKQAELGFCVSRSERATSGSDGEALRPTGDVWPIPDFTTRGSLVPLFESCYISGAGMFARTEMLQSLGGLDSRYVRSQDYHFAVRAALARAFAVLPGGPTYLYAQHDSARGPLSNRIAAQHVLRKWLTFDQSIFFELLASLSDERFAEPGVAGPRSTAVALTNRARASASKLLGEQTFNALLRRASELADLLPDAYERSLLESLPTLGFWYGAGVLAHDRRFWKAVREIEHISAAGAAMADALATKRPSRVLYGLSVIAKGY